MAAYDRGRALRFVLLAAGFLLFVPLSWLGAGDPGRTAAGVLSLGSLAAAAALSAYFLLTYDLHAAETHFAAVSALAEPLLALRPSVTLTDTVNPNVAGGALILLLTGTGGLYGCCAAGPSSSRSSYCCFCCRRCSLPG